MVSFRLPPPGTYQFVCTFPGHSFTEFGEFTVTPIERTYKPPQEVVKEVVTPSQSKEVQGSAARYEGTAEVIVVPRAQTTAEGNII